MNPYKKPKITFETNRLVVVHMEGNRNCLCNDCEDARKYFSRPFDINNDETTPSPAVSSPSGAPQVQARIPALVSPPRNVFRHNSFSPRVLAFGPSPPSFVARNLSLSLNAAASHLHLVPASFHAKDPVSANNRNNDSMDKAANDLVDMGIDLDGVISNVHDVFSPQVCGAFLKPMEKLGVYRLSTAANIAPVDEKQHDMREIDSNHKATFFFTPVMVRDKSVSLINKNSKPEFFKNHNGVDCYNKNFWNDNIEIKTLKEGGNFITLDMAALLPKWTIAESFAHSHQEAMNWMARHGPAFERGQLLYLSLKGDYVHVFDRNMQSELVARARLSGFHPLFLIKNCICQQTGRFGLNGFQMTSINKKPRSYLCLVGFYRGDGDDLEIITLEDTRNNFMVVANYNVR